MQRRRTTFPAANWLATKLAGGNYVLDTLHSHLHRPRVPGLHPPTRVFGSLLPDKPEDSYVVYDNSSPKNLDGPAVLKMIKDVARRRFSVPINIYIALEHADKTLAEGLDAVLWTTNNLEYFIGNTFTSKRDIVHLVQKWGSNTLGGVRPDASIDNVQKWVNMYRGAPGGEYVHEIKAREHQQLLRWARERVAQAKGKAFARIPKKRQLRASLTGWTTETYGAVQEGRRGNTPLANKARKVDYALARHMQFTALRAPQMPPKVRDIETGSSTPNLYRGFSVTTAEFQAMVQRSYVQDKGYLAFTRRKGYAISFGARKDKDVLVVVRLNVRRVARGTPWVWFAGVPETHTVRDVEVRKRSQPFNTDVMNYNLRFTKADLSRNKTFDVGYPMENEVLLPPGYLLINKMQTVKLDFPLVTPTGGRFTSYVLIAAGYVGDGTDPLNRYHPPRAKPQTLKKRKRTARHN